MKNKALKIILIVVGFLVVAGISIWPMVCIWKIKPIGDLFASDKQIIMNEVDAFIHDLAQGSTTDAYNLTNKISVSMQELSNKTFQQSLSKYSGQNPDLHYYDILTFLSGIEQVEYQTGVYFTDNSQGQLEVIVTKVPNGNWKISTIGLDTPPDHFW